MTFNHNLVPLQFLNRIDGEQRYYETPTGEKYPSVTTVLDKTSDKSALDAWRLRVGEDEAARISKRATVRGTAVHTLCERFVLNEDLRLEHEMPFNVDMFKQLQGFLAADVDNIMASEGQLFSHKLKVAGSCDLIAEYRRKKAIIDFKTSTKPKNVEWIENYFIQATMYSFMFWEMTGIHCPTIVIAIAVEEEDKPQIFVDSAKNWLNAARNRCKLYHEKYPLQLT